MYFMYVDRDLFTLNFYYACPQLYVIQKILNIYKFYCYMNMLCRLLWLLV